MKRTKQCPKCESRDVGHLSRQVDANDVQIASGPDGRKGVFAVRGQDHHAIARSVGIEGAAVNIGWGSQGFPLHGALEAYVCTACGYYETYVVTPRTVEWEALDGFTWVNPDPATSGPFR